MAPKKSKGASDEEKVVLDYLVKANRPYSGNDISSQLHGKVSVPQAKKLLNDLAEKGKIQRKDNGKQQVFYANQFEIDVPSVEEAEEEEEKIKVLQEQTEKLKSGIKLKENDARLENLRSGEVISPEEKKKIETEHTTMIKHWKARKRMFKNVSDAIAEGYPGKLKDLFEELGIETDEDVGADTSIIAAN
ncbi:PSMC3 interacting protein [Coemansia sp. RSA 2399]|nr:PSMC3 interacting protein [Coemansia sp. RSA 2399]KAJ1905877.1 PSMC3 interacting protein [Coemansia sp. IMI 209127]